MSEVDITVCAILLMFFAIPGFIIVWGLWEICKVMEEKHGKNGESD